MCAWLPTATRGRVDGGGDAVAGDGVEVGGGLQGQAAVAGGGRRWPRRPGARCRPRRRRPGPAARRRRSRRAVWTCSRVGRPWVMVPVLSRTTAVSRRAVSSASPSPMRMPSSAALPVPTMTAVGVARPRAQGQAMIRTATVVPMARTSRSASGPKAIQPMKVASAASRTAGTNQAETWSASRCIGACGALGVLDQADDLGQRAVGADGGRRGPRGCRCGSTVAPMTVVAGPLVDRDALAGEHRLVDGGGAVDDDAVDGDLLAGPDPDEVADGHLRRGGRRPRCRRGRRGRSWGRGRPGP